MERSRDTVCRVRLCALLTLCAALVFCAVRGSGGPAVANLRKTNKKWQELDNFVKGVIHQAASSAVELGLSEDDGGVPSKQVNTTASGEHLVEELLSNKKLTKEVFLKPNRDGWVQAGKIYDIYMKDAQVGSTTHVGLGDDGEVRFVVTDLAVDVECKYDLRLTTMDFGETGRVVARLVGSGMTLSFPKENIGPGSCTFNQGLDLEIIDAISDRDAINVEIDRILRSNVMGIRSEIVQEMEDGLCKALLEPSSAMKVNHLAMVAPESMWPLVIGSVVALLLLLVLAFLLGCWCAQKDFGASAWSTSKVKRSARVTDEEDGSESEDSISNINGAAAVEAGNGLPATTATTIPFLPAQAAVSYALVPQRPVQKAPGGFH